MLCALTWEFLIILMLYRSLQSQKSRPVPRRCYILRTLYPCAQICNSFLIHVRLWFIAYELWSHLLLTSYWRMIRQQCISDRQSSASLQLWHLNCRNELDVVLQYLSTHLEFYQGFYWRPLTISRHPIVRFWLWCVLCGCICHCRQESPVHVSWASPCNETNSLFSYARKPRNRC